MAKNKSHGSFFDNTWLSRKNFPENRTPRDMYNTDKIKTTIGFVSISLFYNFVL